jgi:hypothetical protein
MFLPHLKSHVNISEQLGNEITDYKFAILAHNINDLNGIKNIQNFAHYRWNAVIQIMME